MPTYVCRWPNGDFSFVSAANKETATQLLDEVGNAEGCPLFRVKDFIAHFRLAKDGRFLLEGFGESTDDDIWAVYPILDKAIDRIVEENPSFQLSDMTEEERKSIEAAVKQERKRIREKEVREPETVLGRDIKKETGAPTGLVNRWVKQAATERIRRFKPKGKPS